MCLILFCIFILCYFIIESMSSISIYNELFSLKKYSFVTTKNPSETRTKVIRIRILKFYSLGTTTIVMTSTQNVWKSSNDFRAKSAIFHLYFLFSSYQCQNVKCLLFVFCFTVINSCVYFVRRELHISWYNLLSNSYYLCTIKYY